MENTFLTNIQKEGLIGGPSGENEEEKETPSAPSADEKPEKDEAEPQTGDGTQKGEGEPNATDKEGEEPKVFQAFHKHPRWLAMQQELTELRDFRDKAAPLLEGIEQSKPKEETTEIPAWFSEIFGDNDSAWKKFRAFNEDQRKQLRTEILEEVKQSSVRVLEEEKQADKWLEEELSGLESDEDTVSEMKKLGIKFDRNAILKVAMDYLPSDEKGNISIKKAYAIWKTMKPSTEKPNASEKKGIADKTMGKGKSESEKRDYKNSADLQGKSFRDLVPDDE